MSETTTGDATAGLSAAAGAIVLFAVMADNENGEFLTGKR